jgi:hypothetical protein
MRTSFDIVGAVMGLRIPLLFRPLNALWGATITVGNKVSGLLVTTKLPLPVQRFTLAHELGHVLLGHHTSLDETIGFAGRFGPTSRPTEELAADTFASELLAPRSLMLAASKRNRWTREALADPANVYQLALRIGVSFKAACWALASNEVLPLAAVRELQDHKVKDLKLSLVSRSLFENPWADVWKLTDADAQSYIEAGPDDVFAFHLEDNASAGFLWELVDIGRHGTILEERVSDIASYGGSTSRIVLIRFLSTGVHRVVFEHRRPWNKQRLGYIDIAIDNHGKEPGGFARRFRGQALEVVG